jgi:hypothetical protein
VRIEGPRYEEAEVLLVGTQPPNVAPVDQALDTPDASTRRTRAIFRSATEVGCRSRRSWR